MVLMEPVVQVGFVALMGVMVPVEPVVQRISVSSTTSTGSIRHPSVTSAIGIAYAISTNSPQAVVFQDN